MLRALRFIVLILSALTVGMKFAHVLELIPKLQLDPEIYIVIQTHLYQLFGTLGPIIDVGTLIVAVILAVRLYRQPAFRLTALAVGAMIVSLLVWLILVQPANAPINQWQASSIIPTDWTHWRDQWQYGQLISFSFDLLGFCLILWSVVRETPLSTAKNASS